MKSPTKISLNFLWVGISLLGLVVWLTHAPISSSQAPVPNGEQVPSGLRAATTAINPLGEAPHIVLDTVHDSPGTNLVTRVVTFRAEIAGTPPPALQWKVDQGAGFENIANATNDIFQISNAQVVHNGFYALFATNSAGSIHSTPARLFVEEGED